MTVSEWISVKDGLPENEEFVLVVCGISNQICLAFYEDGTVREDFSHIAFDEDCDDWIEYDEKYGDISDIVDNAQHISSGLLEET